MQPLVDYALDDGIATITMDDGKANVMSLQMMQELNDAFDRAEADQAVVVLSGRAAIFSGGFDLGVFQRGEADLLEMLETGARMTERLLSFPTPVVAACTGKAVAMGVFLLLASDLRVGVDRDTRIHVNEVRIGLTVPRFAIEICRQRLAPAHLNRAVVAAQPCSPQQAVAAGFLDEVAEPDALAATARERAVDLKAVDAGSFTATKLRLREHALEALREGIRQDVEDWHRRYRGES